MIDQVSNAGRTTAVGHRMADYKPSPEHLEAEYLKAVPFLTVSEAEQAKRQLTEEKEEHERAWKDPRSRISYWRRTTGN
jgi:hypothetical protein